jgi:hypothetical protein
MNFDDPRWAQLRGGYKMPYNPRPALRQLEREGNRKEAWEELWNELHHQGDIGEASYAAIGALVDLEKRHRGLGTNLYALAATIEVERFRKSNPPVPTWLDLDYRRAWTDLANLALEDLRSSDDRQRIRTALAVVALARHQTKLGAFLAYLDDSELSELIEDRLAWSELYRDERGG